MCYDNVIAQDCWRSCVTYWWQAVCRPTY